jgi:hypothetical protein
MRIERRWDEAFKNEVDLWSPIPFYINPILLLAACIMIRLNRVWSYVIGMAISGWLIRRIIILWVELAEGYYHPTLSWSVLHDWWVYQPMVRWDIPRFAIAVLVFVYAAVLVIRYLMQKKSAEQEHYPTNG